MLKLDEAAEVVEAGSKARMLARVRRAGFPAAPGLVILPEENPTEKELELALAELGGGRFVVRSSASVEDQAQWSAAGIFSSEVGRAGKGLAAREVAAAIVQVRASGTSMAARAYLTAHDLVDAKIAVLIQPLVAAKRLGVLHTVLRDGHFPAEERSPGEPEWGNVEARLVPLDDPLAQGALGLARLLPENSPGADVEYALTEDGVVFLQVRPLTAFGDNAAQNWDPGDADEWIFDAHHNPAPLSRAHASLVDGLAGLAGLASLLRQRVINGYLFYAKLAPSSRPAPASLSKVFNEQALPACERLLKPLEEVPAFADPVGLADPAALERALEVFGKIAEIYWGSVSPLIAQKIDSFDDFLMRAVGEPLAAHADLLGGVGSLTVERDQALWELGRVDPALRPALLENYNERFGAYAPVWDVAAACDDEAPLRVLHSASLVGRVQESPKERQARAMENAQEAAEYLRGRLTREDCSKFDELLTAARQAQALTEDDDRLFFRAQRAVRRSLLALGHAAYRAGKLDGSEQVFAHSMAEILAGHWERERAAAAHDEQARAAKLTPPRLIRQRRPSWSPSGPGSGAVLHGAGTGGRVRGRVLMISDPAMAAWPLIPAGAILVVSAMLPSLTFLIPQAAALITDFGGALSHGATLAREYHVPAVLGTGQATHVLRDGEEVFVDADAGRVYRLGNIP